MISLGWKWIFPLIFFVAAMHGELRAEEASPLHLRIMSYNIHIGIGMDGGGPKLDRIAKILMDARCDLVGIQEVDKGTRRTGSVDQLAELKILIGMFGEFSQAIPHDGGEYGVGMLSRREPLRMYAVPLPGKEEARVLQVAEFADFVCFNTHFSLMAESRSQSVALIETEAVKFSAIPVFLTGDLNATPDSDTVAALTKKWTRLSGEEYTYATENPQTTIDYIFVRLPEGFSAKIVEAKRLDERTASDHFPIFVDVIVTSD